MNFRTNFSLWAVILIVLFGCASREVKVETDPLMEELAQEVATQPAPPTVLAWERDSSAACPPTEHHEMHGEKKLDRWRSGDAVFECGTFLIYRQLGAMLITNFVIYAIVQFDGREFEWYYSRDSSNIRWTNDITIVAPEDRRRIEQILESLPVEARERLASHNLEVLPQ